MSNTSEVEWLARNYTATELMEMGGGNADNIVEFVGDWIESNLTYKDEDEWSDLCVAFYEWWGCENLASQTDEWHQFWENKVKEEATNS